MKPAPPLKVIRRPEQFDSDDKRVIPRPLAFNYPPRVRAILRRLLKIPEFQVQPLLETVLRDFAHRHRDVTTAFEENYHQAVRHARDMPAVSPSRRLLIGSYFTMEYSIESAALFNPSIVPHPDQADLPPGAVRFLMSLRATGEGHLSSIVFRRGVIDPEGAISFDPPPRYAYTARPAPDEAFDKRLFAQKLKESGICNKAITPVLELLGDPFTRSQLRSAITQARQAPNPDPKFRETCDELLWLVQANYRLEFPPDCLPAETVIFPATQHEQRGMEDLRLTRFVDDTGVQHYCGTYTAYDGHHIHPMLLETDDFRGFHIRTLFGRYVKNKGMALFPRPIGGAYCMLSRHDGESLFLLRSPSLYVWNQSQKLYGPSQPWELLQIGNCGSPLETDKGWIVLTHGVGPMRQYCIGAILLDLNNPAKVIGRLPEPLLAPTPHEREGYVPNVLYTCGSMIHHGQLVIPYAMSDSRTSFATVNVADLLAAMLAQGPKRR